MKILGIWDGASQLLLSFLEFLYGITHSYGFAIIILTLIVRVALYPLNQKQMVSMQHMQKIQPMLKVIQEKYGHDRERMNQETMRLYKEYKVNPAAGCLPILVQLPILILLFNVLNTYDFADTTFMGVLLGSSATAGLGQAVGVAPGPDGIYSIFAVLGGIFSNPAGLARGALFREPRSSHRHLRADMGAAEAFWRGQQSAARHDEHDYARLHGFHLPFDARRSNALLGPLLADRYSAAVLRHEKDEGAARHQADSA